MAAEAKNFLPTVVIVGRPNVGKSALFNRLLGRRRSIVGDEPGITRDRIHGVAEWRGKRFELVDTGGLLPGDDSFLPSRIQEQIRTVLVDASLVLFVVDAHNGVTPVDEELARQLRWWGYEVILVVNKVDSANWESHVEEFHGLGFERVFPIAAEHGRGIGDMLDALWDDLPDALPLSTSPTPSEIKIAVIGRPNVGKSSVVNALLGTERVIVSPVPGTTRDAIDSELTYKGQSYRLVDTAGIRRRSRVIGRTERVAIVMAQRHIERSDVAILLMDAIEGPTGTDAKIAAFAHEAGKSIILAINKWDLVVKSRRSGSEYELRIRNEMRFLDYAPVVFVSALTGLRVTKLLDLAAEAYSARFQRISTGELNRFFERFLAEPRFNDLARSMRLYYITQAAIDPPTFVVFGRAKNARLRPPVERFLVHQLRAAYRFFATPIHLRLRRR